MCSRTRMNNQCVFCSNADDHTSATYMQSKWRLPIHIFRLIKSNLLRMLRMSSFRKIKIKMEIAQSLKQGFFLYGMASVELLCDWVLGLASGCKNTCRISCSLLAGKATAVLLSLLLVKQGRVIPTYRQDVEAPVKKQALAQKLLWFD